MQYEFFVETVIVLTNNKCDHLHKITQLLLFQNIKFQLTYFYVFLILNQLTQANFNWI